MIILPLFKIIIMIIELYLFRSVLFYYLLIAEILILIFILNPNIIKRATPYIFCLANNLIIPLILINTYNDLEVLYVLLVSGINLYMIMFRDKFYKYMWYLYLIVLVICTLNNTLTEVYISEYLKVEVVVLFTCTLQNISYISREGENLNDRTKAKRSFTKSKK